jgi:UDP-N-acetylmuramoyl-tripeptide--D-alanyl-D-alanine ligase
LNAGFWTDAAVRQALAQEGGEEGRAYTTISTDTRKIGPGALFVALAGERFDGHRFLDQAAAAGATGAVVSEPGVSAPEGMTLYTVPDTLEALARLGAYRRDRLRARFVGIVGSNGKTTTKELVRAVLQTRFRTHATEGNLNNQIGVPLTLFAVPDDAEVAVVEMGTNRPGEISILTRIVRPDVAVVTSIGEEHLELLGDLEGVLREEISVLEGLQPEARVLVAEEPDTLPRAAREILGRARVRVAGLRESSDLRPDGGERAVRVLDDGSTLWVWRGHQVRLPIPGRFNVRNALLALGVATEFGVPAEEAVRGLSQVRLPRFRGEWVRFGELRVLADCYNANPPSVAAAVDLIVSLPARGRNIVVLGTMRELGSVAGELHALAAERIVKKVGRGVDLVVATGEFAPAFEAFRAKLGERLVIADDPLQAYEQVRHGLDGTETILLKASRGDQMERWLPLLERDFGEAPAE